MFLIEIIADLHAGPQGPFSQRQITAAVAKIYPPLAVYSLQQGFGIALFPPGRGGCFPPAAGRILCLRLVHNASAYVQSGQNPACLSAVCWYHFVTDITHSVAILTVMAILQAIAKGGAL